MFFLKQKHLMKIMYLGVKPAKLVSPTNRLVNAPFVIPTSWNVNDEKYRTPFMPVNCWSIKREAPMKATTVIKEISELHAFELPWQKCNKQIK